MPEVKYNVNAARAPFVPRPEESEEHEDASVLAAAFRQENDVYNWWQYLTKPSHAPDQEFNLVNVLKSTPYWHTDRERFIGVTSQAEFDDKVAAIEQERKDKATLARAGAVGVLAQLGAALVSPTVFIPAVGTLRYGVKAAAVSGAALGAAAGGLQELPLQLAQEDRETASALAAVGIGSAFGAVVGGMLGKSAIRRVESSVLNETHTHEPFLDLTGAGELREIVAPQPFNFTFTKGEMDVTVNAERVVVVSKRGLDLLSEELGTRKVDEVVEALRARDYDGVYIHPEVNGGKPENNLILFREGLVHEEPRGEDAWGFPEVGDGVYRVPGKGASVGAASAKETSAGKTKKTVLGTAPIAKAVEKFNPVIRTINQDVSLVAREMMAKLSDAGVKFERNVEGVPTAKGGTVENRIGEYDAFLAKGITTQREMYTRYIYGSTSKKIFTKTAIVGHLADGKLSYSQFKLEVARALREGGEHEIPEVKEAAKALRENVYDPILARAQEVGLIPEELRDIADAGYLNRVYDRAAIELNPTRFVDILASHFESKLQERYAKIRAGVLKAEKELARLEMDVELSPKQVAAAKKVLKEELKKLDDLVKEIAADGTSAKETEIDEAIARAKQHAMKGALPVQDRRDWSDMAKAIEASRGDPLRILERGKKTIRKRLANLNKAKATLAEKQASLLERANKADELNLKGMQKAANAGKTLLNKIDKTEVSVEEGLKRAREIFTKAVGAYERTAHKLAELRAENLNLTSKRDLARGKRIEKERIRLGKQAARLKKLVDRLGKAEAAKLTKEELKAVIREGLDATLANINRINSKRAVRAAKLREMAAKATPESVDEMVARLREKVKEKRFTALDKLRELGADDVDLALGTADFARKAREDAELIKSHILQTNSDMPTVELMLGPRGPELTRGLASLPSNAVEDFLINDTEDLAFRYINAFGPDIELTRAFGSINAEEQFLKLMEEQNAVERVLRAKLDAAKTEKEKRVIEKEQARVVAIYDDARKSLKAVIQRLRNRRGIPANPDSLASRMGYAAMGINTLRMMGMVVVSSLPDLARPMFRFGIAQAYRHAWKPLFTDWQKLKLTRRQLRIAGAAVELVTHNRTRQLTDMLGRMPLHATKFERAVEYGSSRMGLVAGFSYWTNFMKELHGSVAIADTLDKIDLVVNGRGKAKEIAEATEYLASAGIDADLAIRIWALTTDGKGGIKYKGTWLPNTAEWADREAAEAFHAAIRREVNIGIVTPGVDKPLFADANLAMKLVMQFKSFAMASMSRTLMAGLQDSPARFVHATIASLALGALSYALWSLSVGGEAEKEMRKAPWQKWLDEAVDRSGVLAAFGEGQRILSQFPGLNSRDSWVRITFSGRPATRRASGPDVLKYVLGPTGGLVSSVGGIATSLQSPTTTTARQVRSLLPYNQVFYLRRIVTALEKSSAKALGLRDPGRAKK